MTAIRRPDTLARERAHELVRSWDGRPGALGSLLGRVSSVDQDLASRTPQPGDPTIPSVAAICVYPAVVAEAKDTLRARRSRSHRSPPASRRAGRPERRCEAMRCRSTLTRRRLRRGSWTLEPWNSGCCSDSQTAKYRSARFSCQGDGMDYPNSNGVDRGVGRR